MSFELTPPALEKSLNFETKLRHELLKDIKLKSMSLMELSSLAQDIHAKTQEASQNTNLVIR